MFDLMENSWNSLRKVFDEFSNDFKEDGNGGYEYKPLITACEIKPECLTIEVKEGYNFFGCKIDTGKMLQIDYSEPRLKNTFIVSIPEDADISTMDANIGDDGLVVTIKKKAK